MRLFCITPLLAGASLTLSACHRHADSVEGRWVGTVEVADDLIFARGELIRSWQGLSGKFQLKDVGELTLVGWSGFDDDVVLQMRAGNQEGVLSGRISQSVLTGTLGRADDRVPIRLHRIAQVHPHHLEGLVGTYFAGPNWVRSVRYCEDAQGWGQLIAVNDETGARKALFPINENTFFFGPGYLLPDPIQGRVTFVRDADGSPDRLLWEEEGFSPTVADRCPQASGAALARTGGPSHCEPVARRSREAS